MNSKFHIIIPARYNSARFPGKLLQLLHGVSVLERVYKQAQLAGAESITIATDSDEIQAHAEHFGARVVRTASSHQSGTDRIAEVVSKGGFAAQDLIVNVQGDEPFIAPELIRQVAQSLAATTAPMATLCWPIESEAQLSNPNVVKVVRTANNQAMYFSRSPIPLHRDNPGNWTNSFRHIGLYAYRAAFLLDYVSWPVCALELQEGLEQLRVLWNGASIQVDEACMLPLQDINTPEDLLEAQKIGSCLQ